jgi:hypothetical protein
MIRTQKIKFQQCKILNIFVFSIKMNENARIKQELDIKILLYVKINKTSRISRRKLPTQDGRTINEKDDEKGTTQKFNQIKVSYHSTDSE